MEERKIGSVITVNVAPAFSEVVLLVVGPQYSDNVLNMLFILPSFACSDSFDVYREIKQVEYCIPPVAPLGQCPILSLCGLKQIRPLFLKLPLDSNSFVAQAAQ